MTDAQVSATTAVRWRIAMPGRRRFAASVCVAALLHGAVGVAVLTAVHAPPPVAVNEQIVEVVFAPPATEAPAPAERSLPDVVTPTASADTQPPPDSTPPVEPPLVQAEPPPAAPVATPKPAIPAPKTPRPAIAHTAPHHPEPDQRARVTEVPAVNPAPAPAAPAAAQRTAAAPIPGEWQSSFTTWLAGHKTYPHMARQRGIEGVVTLQFTADRAGHVLSVEVVHSAGSTTLDEAAEAILRDATVPPFPPDMAQNKATVTVQIRYELAK